MTEKSKSGPSRKHHALGRGLAALLGEAEAGEEQLPTEPRVGERIIELPLERLEPNPFQPRRVFDPLPLKSLSESIASQGLLQPLVVRPASGGYQLIAGERRLRACQMAGLVKVPVVVRQATDQQALLLALLENLQREDLDPLEEARAYARLAEDFGLTQEEIASGVGRERSTVTNTMRLLKLPREIQDDLAAGRITAGHARSLLALENEAAMRAARDRVVKESLSVRATERLVKTMLTPAPPTPPPPPQDDVYIQSLASGLQQKLGTRVEIKRKGKKGRLILDFYSDQDLERLLELLGGKI